MNKYYVYYVRKKEKQETDRTHAYVDARFIKEFAQETYDPVSMEFTGIAVEADDPKAASEIYNSPASGEYYMQDEPRETVLKRKAFEARNKISKDKIKDLAATLQVLHTHGSKMAAAALARKLARKFMEINDDMIDMARHIRNATNEHPKLSMEEVYNRIKTQYLMQLENELKYKDGDKN